MCHRRPPFWPGWFSDHLAFGGVDVSKEFLSIGIALANPNLTIHPLCVEIDETDDVVLNTLNGVHLIWQLYQRDDGQVRGYPLWWPNSSTLSASSVSQGSP